MKLDKTILATNLNNGAKLRFSSVKDASKELGVVTDSVYKVLRGEMTHSKGYYFEHAAATLVSVKVREALPLRPHKPWCVVCGLKALASLEGVCFRCLKREDRVRATNLVKEVDA